MTDFNVTDRPKVGDKDVPEIGSRLTVIGWDTRYLTVEGEDGRSWTFWPLWGLCSLEPRTEQANEAS